MRIEQNIGFLGDLVKMAHSGRLGVPAFQRPYVWEETDVEAFFDSILRRLPVGTFLLWEADAGGFPQHVTGRLGPLAPSQETTHLLLDGQNRLATMLWAYAGSDCAEASPHEISVWRSRRVLVADAAVEAVRFVPAEESRTGARVPMGSLLKSVFSSGEGSSLDRFSLMSELADRGGTGALHFVFDELIERIRSARTVTTVLQNASVEEARQAFLAICRSGQPMSEEDFDAAVSWTAGGHAP